MQLFTKKKRKSAPKNRWHKTATYLPEALTRKLYQLNNSGFFKCKKEYWRCIKLMSRIYKSYENSFFQNSVDLPQNYVRKIVSSDGMNMWSRIRKEEDILIQTRNHGTHKKQAKSYIINPNYLDGEPTRIEFKEVGRKLEPFEREVVNILKRTTLELPGTPEDLVEKKREKFRNSITKRIDFDKKEYKPYKGKKFIIEGYVEDFIYNELERRINDEISRLNSIIKGNWRANRNLTNNRLDTNYTNLNAEYKKYIMIDGKPTKSIDLSNSQFCIFSNLIYDILYNNGSLYESIDNEYINEFIMWCKMYTMSNDIDKEDLHRFCQASFQGTLYETLANDLKIDSELSKERRRTIAKNYAFNLFFGNVNYSGKKTKQFKSELERTYPTVVALVDAYKKYSTSYESTAYYEDSMHYKANNKNKSHLQVGSNNFSKFLQLTESFIFIDQMYMPMVEQGDPVLTVHDSFLYSIDYKIDQNLLGIWLPSGYKIKE
jgi:hypothetical protein